MKACKLNCLYVGKIWFKCRLYVVPKLSDLNEVKNRFT